MLLIGLVGLNVSLLKLNAHNGRTAEIARDLRIQNAKLRGSVSRLGSSERLQQAARDMGLVMPTPQMVTLPHAPTRAPTAAAPRATCGWRWVRPARSSSSAPPPKRTKSCTAPTPSQPIVEQTGARSGRDGARGRDGRSGRDRSGKRDDRAHRGDRPHGAAGTPGG